MFEDWIGIDFGFDPEDASVFCVRSQYYMEFEVPLADVPESMLKVMMGEDYWANMYRQQEADQRWADDGGAYL